MRIPPDSLAAEVLFEVALEFVSRDGTRQGDLRAAAADTVRALHAGRAVLWFDEDDKTCHILSAEEFRRRGGA